MSLPIKVDSPERVKLFLKLKLWRGKESWVFQMAGINQALTSIADRVDNKYRVVFFQDDKTGRDASYMIVRIITKTFKMIRFGNVWIIEALIGARNMKVLLGDDEESLAEF